MADPPSTSDCNSSNMAEKTKTKKMFTMLENNPDVINSLATSLGLDDSLCFYDVYSLTDADLLAFIPRPVYALLVIIPLTPGWARAIEAEDADKAEYGGKGETEPVLWFKQTIGNACGGIGLVHCLLNGEASQHIRPGSTLDTIRQEAVPKSMWERAKVLEDSVAFEQAHAAAAQQGDTATTSGDGQGQHFVAFVKARDGHLWELEGGRKGPLDRGALADDDDVLSAAAVEKGLGRIMGMGMEEGADVRFSAIALAARLD
jgi:ubiquitin carboxyl-terminal hydrolase L3